MILNVSATGLFPRARYLRRLVSSVTLLVLVLSSVMAVLPAASEVATASGPTLGNRAEYRVARVVPPSLSDQDAKCIFCERSVCAGLDTLLPSTSVDVALLPVSDHPVVSRNVVRLPPSRAPPPVTGPPAVPFDSRAPPSLG
jgi:hypothetical protein